MDDRTRMRVRSGLIFVLLGIAGIVEEDRRTPSREHSNGGAEVSWLQSTQFN
jgi:hypothetical protein